MQTRDMHTIRVVQGLTGIRLMCTCGWVEFRNFSEPLDDLVHSATTHQYAMRRRDGE